MNDIIKFVERLTKAEDLGHAVTTEVRREAARLLSEHERAKGVPVLREPLDCGRAKLSSDQR